MYKNRFFLIKYDNISGFFFSLDIPVFLLYLVWVFCCGITLGVSRFLQRNPFPSLIKGHHRLHRFIWVKTGIEDTLSILVTVLSKKHY